MLQADEIVVISDLHISAERGRGLFQADDELASFLAWLHGEVRPCTLFLNGDVLDFLVLGDGEDTAAASDLAEAAARAKKMIENHEEVFRALSLLAKSPDHEVVILAGNHDPELVLPEVQSVVGAALGRLTGALGKAAVTWLAHGLAARARVGAAEVVIEHGDTYDAWNKIDHETLRRELMLSSRGIDPRHRKLPLRLLGLDIRYTPPPGTEFVGLLRDVRREFPWVDLLKPEAAVLSLVYANVNHNPLIDRSRRARLLSLIRQYGRMKVRSVVSEARRLISPRTLYRTSQAETDDGGFERWLQSVEQRQTRGFIREWGVGTQIDLLVPYLRQTAITDSFFNPDVPDAGARDAAFLAAQGGDVIINGHTHAAKAYVPPGGKGLYLNSGTWARLMQLPPGGAEPEVWSQFIRDLNAGKEQGFSRPTFIRVRAEGGRTVASLSEWRDGAPATLSRWGFAPDSREWLKEG